MAKQSAGLLLFRGAPGAVEVLLVHPGGPFWAKKDEGAWSIPKGEFSADEDSLQAALREFKEEMGEDAAGAFIALEPQRQAGGKIVHAWAVEADFDPGCAATRSQSNGRRVPDDVEHFPKSTERHGSCSM